MFVGMLNAYLYLPTCIISKSVYSGPAQVSQQVGWLAMRNQWRLTEPFMCCRWTANLTYFSYGETEHRIGKTLC